MKFTLLLSVMGLVPLLLTAQNPVSPPSGGMRPGPGGPGAEKKATIPGTEAPKGNGKIKGVVVDSTTKKPVQFATVALLAPADNKPIDGVVSEEDGSFLLSKVAAGEYRVSVTFIGYKTKVMGPVKLGSGRDEENLGKIFLAPDVTSLKEVTITGEKDLVEDKIDRIVYNAEKDITNAGGNASDVLKKVPMLSVDLEGNVSMRGSSNVRVLINGKPSSIMASSVADALRQIPADMIKTVEVITSPSAKYDSEGTAGIINIITKKNNLQGVNGSVNASGGNRYSYAGGNVNVRKKKLGGNASLGLNYFNGRSNSFTNRENRFYNPAAGEFQTGSYLTQTSDGFNEGVGAYGQTGLDYDFNAKSTLSTSIRFNSFTFQNWSDLYSEVANASGQIVQQYDRNTSSRNRWGNFDWNLDYTKTFKQAGRELTFLGQYSSSQPKNNFRTFQYDETGLLDSLVNSNNLSENREITLQTDYVQPFKNKTTLEVGAKSILRRVSSDYQIFASGSENQPLELDPRRSNVFDYDQNVVSGYATYKFTIKKFGFNAGARYEGTFIDADFRSQQSEFSDRYQNFIPSVTVSRDLKKNQKLKLSYTQRIQRPSIFYLNPYVNYSDPKNIQYGNPNLDPELTHSYELSYSRFTKSNSITTSLYVRQTNNAIEWVRLPVDSDGVSRTTYQNISRNYSYGMSVFGNLQILPKWKAGGNVNVYYVDLKNPATNTGNSSWMYNFNVNSSYTFNKGFSAQFFGFFHSPRVQLQGRTGGFYNYNLAVKKEIMKKKGSVSVGLDNPLSRTIRFRSEFNTPSFSSLDIRNQFRRSVRVSLNYQFGKMDFNGRPPRQKRSIRNDDAKQGESSN